MCAASEVGRCGSRCACRVPQLYWSAQVRPARGDKGVSFSVLRTERGLRGLSRQGAITEQELELLMHNAALSETQRHHAVLEWMLVLMVNAQRTGLLQGDVAMQMRLLEEATKLRAVCASITDDAAARMVCHVMRMPTALMRTPIAKLGAG